MMRRAVKKPANAKPRAPQQVRIIGGQWKRTPLAVLDAEGLRPTPDRVRETVFNWINHLLDGTWEHLNCLDLFAGTGALGFEAASRGAARVVMVESNLHAVRQLQATKTKLKAECVKVLRGDALAVGESLKRQSVPESRPFKLIFLDPPYHQQWIEKMLPVCEHLLADGGLVYVEAEAPLGDQAAPAWLAGWEVVRADKAGMVFYHLLQRKVPSGFQA
jgi:16S rRNA (guanine(966)-N(2))-methyltransferase RsmD